MMKVGVGAVCGGLAAVSLAFVESTVDAAPVASAAYVSVQPCRLADTRLADGYERIDALTLQILARGVCGIPANATSVALTLTVVGPQAAGFLTAWPADQARPVVSNVNFDVGQIRANGSITRVDASGAFRVFTSAPADVVVDVVGAFVPASAAAAGRFVARPSTRLYDSRSGPALAPGATTTLPLPAGVPADAVAMALNVTITESSAPGFVTEFPAGRQMPTSSILNVDQAGQTRAAAGIFPVSPTGVALYLSGGGHIVVDLLGYFTGPSAGSGTDGLFTAYDPTRLLDTRGQSPLGNGVPLYPGRRSGARCLSRWLDRLQRHLGRWHRWLRHGIPCWDAAAEHLDGQLGRRQRRRGELRHHPGLEPRPRLLQPIADPPARRSAGLVLGPLGDRNATAAGEHSVSRTPGGLLAVHQRWTVVAERDPR